MSQSKWTPEVQEAISEYAQAQLQVMKIGMDPKISPLISGIRVVFNSITSVIPKYKKACAALGVEHGHGSENYNDRFNENFQKMIDFANENGQEDIASTLELARGAWREAYDLGKTPYQRIKAAKKLDIKFDQ